MIEGATGRVVHTERDAHTRRCTRKVEHTKGGLWHTAGVMLFQGPQARRYTKKVVHTQGGAHKAEHTKGGVWPMQESCY